MAFLGAVRAMLGRHALAKIEQATGIITEAAVASWLRSEILPESRQPFASFQAIARQALGIYSGGLTVSHTPAGIVAGRNLAVDPTIRADDLRYRYQVLIVGRSAATDAEFRALAYIDTDTPMSGADVEARARQMYQDRNIPGYTNRIARGFSTLPLVDVQILTAGRRGS